MCLPAAVQPGPPHPRGVRLHGLLALNASPRLPPFRQALKQALGQLSAVQQSSPRPSSSATAASAPATGVSPLATAAAGRTAAALRPALASQLQCPVFATTGRCPKGDHCPLAHGQGEADSVRQQMGGGGSQLCEPRHRRRPFPATHRGTRSQPCHQPCHQPCSHPSCQPGGEPGSKPGRRQQQGRRGRWAPTLQGEGGLGQAAVAAQLRPSQVTCGQLPWIPAHVASACSMAPEPPRVCSASRSNCAGTGARGCPAP